MTQPFVVVPRADADSYLHPLATRAGERVAAPVASFIELAQQAAYVTVVMAQRDAEQAAGDAAAGWLASMAAKLGYATRVCEFDDELLVDIADVNEYVTQRLEQFHREHTMGADWFATLCGTAAMITTTVQTAPYSPDAVDLLAPTGFGHDAHVAVCSWLINGFARARRQSDEQPPGRPRSATRNCPPAGPTATTSAPARTRSPPTRARSYSKWRVSDSA